MIDSLIAFDKELFLFLNSKHLTWLDPLMLLLSSYAMWAAAYIGFGLLVFLISKKHKIASIIFYASAVGLTALLTNGLKLLVDRPRPIHEEVWDNIIHNIERYSTASSFFSSHAATTFCMAVFIFLFFKTKKIYGYVALVWAMGVSYSRIYVGKHYPLDVAVGTLFGVFMGYLAYRMLMRYIAWKDRLRD